MQRPGPPQRFAPGGAATARRRAVVVAGLAALLAGCAASVPVIDTRAGLGCVDDTPDCVAKRQETLRHMVSDRERGWVREPASAEAYASGVRLFAFKARKKDLTCDELAQGRREADGARTSLAAASGRLTPAQVSRGAMLGAEVSRELDREIKLRCKRT